MSIHTTQDERRVLTMREIEKGLRSAAIIELVAMPFSMLFLGLGVLLCVTIPIAFPGGVLSFWWILTPAILLAAYLSLFVGYQILVTVRACRLAYGRRYRLALDTLYKISEGETIRLPFFSVHALGGTRRSSLFGSRQNRRERTVTGYYFDNNGRGTSWEFSLRDGDFVGDMFYLVIDTRDGKIVNAYNTKKYRLENEL